MATGRRWLEEEIRAVHPPIWGRSRETKKARAPAGDVEYVVVDEIEEAVATLVIEPWPELDRQGRLNFSGSELRQDVQVERQQFEQLLEDRVAPGQLTAAQLEAFATRPLRVGDVFCAVVDRARMASDPDSPARWLKRPVVDVSAEAREVAKTQYFAAVGPVLGPAQVEEMADEFFDEPEPA
jgi:hypothetical protein